MSKVCKRALTQDFLYFKVLCYLGMRVHNLSTILVQFFVCVLELPLCFWNVGNVNKWNQLKYN